ncbi:MAG: hypothetical protein ACO37W_09155 [Prochlorotrichaceae cyanobacterium]
MVLNHIYFPRETGSLDTAAALILTNDRFSPQTQFPPPKRSLPNYLYPITIAPESNLRNCFLFLSIAFLL